MTDRSLRILSVSISDTRGGASRAAVRINQALKEQPVEIKMLVKHKKSDNPDVIPLNRFEPRNLFFKVFAFGQNKFKNFAERLIWRWYPEREDVFLSGLRSVSLHGALQKLDYDILHLHWINLRFLDLRELKKVNKPIVWTLHDCWPFTGICHYFYQCTRYQMACGKCPALRSQEDNDLSHKVWKTKNRIYPYLNIHVVAPSWWLAESARKSTLFSRFPVTVIPHCIDTDLFSPGNRKEACHLLGLPPEKRYLLFGAMNAIQDKNKGFNYLDKAMEMLVKKPEFSDVELLLFGADDSTVPRPENYTIRSLGIITSDDRLVAAYRSAQVTIVPSLSENLSLTIMESMACGTPVTAFHVSGNSELIDHLENGYLADEKDPSGLAKGIEWCLISNLEQQLSDHSRDKIISDYSFEKISSQYLNIYHSN